DPQAFGSLRATRSEHVTARVDEEAARTGVDQQVARVRHGPSLDQPRRVEPRRTGNPRPEADIERAVRLGTHLVATRQHLSNLGARVLEPQLIASKPHDLGVRLPGAEQVVDSLEPGEAGFYGRRIYRIADVDTDDGSPHLLGAPHSEDDVTMRALCRARSATTARSSRSCRSRR